jgi:periplasmic protein TonB
MISDHGKKQKVLLSFVLAWTVFLSLPSLASQQNDPFYLRVFEKAQKSFLAKNYWDAAQDFEIAAFGLNQDQTLRAKAYFFIGLCHFYLQDITKSESFLLQGIELLGDRSLAVLEMPGVVLPDLAKLLTFFDIQLAQPAPPVDPPAAQKREEQEKPSLMSPKADKENPQPAQNEPAKEVQKDPGSAPTLTLGQIKEGDIVALNMVDTLPVATRRIPAIYPSLARGARIEGTVTVNALISEKGSVVKAEIIQGMKGAFGFDQAAVQAVRRWKFEPATIKGIKVKVWLPISIVFKEQE